MFHHIFGRMSLMHQGLFAIVLGFVLLFGALGKLGFLQDFLNIIMVIVGLYVLVWGLDKSNLWKKIRGIRS